MAMAKPDLTAMLPSAAIKFAESANAPTVGGQGHPVDFSPGSQSDSAQAKGSALDDHSACMQALLAFVSRPREPGPRVQANARIPPALDLGIRQLSAHLLLQTGRKITYQDIVEFVLQDFLDRELPEPRTQLAKGGEDT